MGRRLRDLFTRAERAADPGPLRPNQLRLQDVTAQRQHREAVQDAGRQAVRRLPRETDPRPPRPTAPPPSPPPTSALRAALSSRDGLRQAMLLREVLDPPLSLRDQETGRSRF
jgi:hypothetical protein